jgi:uncharacterized protein
MDPDSALRQMNLGLVRDYIAGINAWDFDGMRDLLAEDVVFEIRFPAPGMRSRIEGREALLDFQRSVSSMILSENLHDLRLDTLHSDPGEVLAEYRSDMRMADPSLRYTNDYLSRFTIRDGRITRFVEAFDSVRLVQGFGGRVEAPVIG